MQALWFSHLKTDEERKNFKDYLLNSGIILDKLKDICYNVINESEVNTNDYDSPSWAYKQAHANGVKSAMDKMIKLLTLEPTHRTK